jgi:hypothetical protein
MRQTMTTPTEHRRSTQRSTQRRGSPHTTTAGSPPRTAGPGPVPAEPDTAATEEGAASTDAATAAPARPSWWQRRRERRARRVVRVTDRRLRRVGLISATVVSAVVGFLTALLVFLAGIGVWTVAEGSGLVQRGEDVISTVTTDGTYALDGADLLAGWAFLAVLWAVTLTFLGFVLTVIVNLACLLTGGIRLRFTTKPMLRAEAEPQGRTASAEPTSEDDEIDLHAEDDTAPEVDHEDTGGRGGRGGRRPLAA